MKVHPEAQGSQLETWIGARAHVSPLYLLALFAIYPPEELMKAAKQSNVCHRYFMLPSQIRHYAARDCHL